MATRANPQRSGKQSPAGRGNLPGRSLPGSADVGYPAAQGESTALAVGVIVCLVVIVGFITISGFLYADLMAARGANKKVEKRVDELKRQYEVDCRKKDYE